MLIHRILYIGHWRCDFFFVRGGIFDGGSVMECLEDMDADDDILRQCWRTIRSGAVNEGFTYSRSDQMRSCIFIGPASDGAEFLDTFTHELRHLADHIAQYLRIDLRGEENAYITGDTARDLAEIVCDLGCPHCNGSG